MSHHVLARMRRALLGRALATTALLLAALTIAPAAHAARSALSSGSQQTCAVTTSSGVACWGNFSDGRAPDAAKYSKTVPTLVPEAAPAESVAAGLQAYQCAVRTDHTVGCWGAGWWVDEDYFPRTEALPVDLVTDSNGAVITNFVDVAVNDVEGCGVRTSGLVVCWRTNGVASPIPNTGTATSITNVGAAFCALLAAGNVHCFDRGSSRGSGTWGPTWPWTNVPATQGFPVPGITNAVTISGSCAILADATVKCWTFDHRPQAGEEYLTYTEPVAVPGLSQVVRLAKGTAHACAIVGDGDVYCWGGNGSGQLGNSLVPTGSSTTPLKVDRLNGKATDVSVTASSSCARLTDASIRCWGDPSLSGQANPLPTPGYVPRVPDGNLSIATSAEPKPILDATRPSAPRDSSEVSFGDVTTTSIIVRWLPPLTIPTAGLKQYEVTLGGQTKIVSAPQTSASFTGLTPATDYTAEVVAVDNDGNASEPLMRDYTTQASLVLGPPVFESPDITPYAITIRWRPTGSLSPVSHQLEVDGREISIPGDARSYVITGLSPSTEYAITLTARDGEGQQQASASVSYRTLRETPGTTPTPTPPPTPTPTPTSTPTSTPTPTPAPSPTPPWWNEPYQGSYTVKGTTTITSLSKSAMPLTGSATLNAIRDEFGGGNVTLNDTQGRGTALGFLPVTTTIGFVSSGTGTTSGSSRPQTLTVRVRIKVRSVKAFGAIPLAGGNTCQTKELTTLPLVAQPGFTPRTGGALSATYSISNLNGCGLFEGLVNPLVASTGNTMSLTLSR